MKRDVTFKSEGVDCAGWYFEPDGPGPFPAVAMAHGMGAVKEMYIEPFAQAFAAAGIAVLLFDYRYYGASGGEPRSKISPRDQIEDYRNALTWLSLQPEVDENRLGVWGTSFSGGHVLWLGACDVRVKAVVSQVGAMDLYRNARMVMPEEAFNASRAMSAMDRKRRYTEGDTPFYIANASPPGGPPAMQVDQETYDWLLKAQSTVAPSWRNEVTLCSIERIVEHAAALHVDRIAPTPLLMILATEDKWTPPELIRETFARAGEPKRLLEIEGGHYVVYEGEGQQRAAAAATDWFTTHLGARRA
jgi:dienelactone hydrolase